MGEFCKDLGKRLGVLGADRQKAHQAVGRRPCQDRLQGPDHRPAQARDLPRRRLQAGASGRHRVRR